MEARQVDELPAGETWQYEPKWDGFRCLAFRDGDKVDLQSRNARPLRRYFPDVAAALLDARARRFVLDGELVVPVRRRLSFEQLQLRLHPAASRVSMLADQNPALLIAFDLLVSDRGTDLTARPFRERRERLEAFGERFLSGNPAVRITPATVDRATALQWLQRSGAALDGVIAKRLDLPYASDQPNAILKVKRRETADCVVGGFRYGSRGGAVGSLLLGLYDSNGLLDHVGFTSSLERNELRALTPKFEELGRKRKSPKGFTGRAPDGPSRWSSGEKRAYQPLPHELVVEVEYDHVTENRFRHGTRFVRWRPDKDPAACLLRQIHPRPGAMRLLKEESLHE
jgi:ATP-dependent DNA ligase